MKKKTIVSLNVCPDIKMFLEKIEFKNQIVPKMQVLNDYYTGYLSRMISELGRKEVHAGRAYFGIFGDGKELVQLVLASYFKKGDWRSGYYRDQTLMMALNLVKPEELFAQIYGDSSSENNSSTSGRNFNNHHATATINNNGNLLDHSNVINSSSDISPTAGQMPRLLGLAYASKLVKEDKHLKQNLKGKVNGNEVAFGTIGDASTSEGMFFETINAAAVIQVPMVVVVYDDGYGISVPKELQTARGSISKALKGFQRNGKNDTGIEIFQVEGWNYQKLHQKLREGIELCRKDQVPVVFHITEMTQPLGHSTSGSHERYKTKGRLDWEKQFDPLVKFRQWVLGSGIADVNELNEIESKAKREALLAKHRAWNNLKDGIKYEVEYLKSVVYGFVALGEKYHDLGLQFDRIVSKDFVSKAELITFAKKALRRCYLDKNVDEVKMTLISWIQKLEAKGLKEYSSNLYQENQKSTLRVKPISPVFFDNSKTVNGQVVLNENFKELFKKIPTLLTFGEDTGKLGGVNQVMKGMQEEYGVNRVMDTGIRETTIIGQGIGLAIRGLRPIAEIQYLDYLIYALSTLSDDLATTSYRTNGRQAVPLIVRTRGHQLQGMWHTGSPMSMLIGALQGMYLCVPRNMLQAAGYYNTLARGNDPGLVIEPLKAYGMKERLPENLGDFCMPLGVPEVLVEGNDLTLVTYGWNVHIAMEAAAELLYHNIFIEVIDVGTLIPFDIHQIIKESVKKTNKLIVLDEDIKGGASAYILQNIMEGQESFFSLDASPKTLTACNHRGAYGIDGEYFSKPNVEKIVEEIIEMMHEYNRHIYSSLYK